ncbi:DUF3100 domain-containing protein [Phyllobacterium endophyticum]|uniref:DUF3100 domain-containing protein n=1 Tax=Phyllobacterium endophyticum TaxID=1149773 RepID=A0A2P7AS14_9HYPH|nr:DUF3100 domain-containing protein [Phyllobacterium endophyticum]MBB3236726.1 hypothetical protein [Phyllobacterium endophyticum]PSH57011.1 DUF3100 domain-containing protein [Phyllobacterium endophyticum]TYR39698.1 DUF3100 domain-containing protein [Phyllobacterium endophyticum]
MTERIMAVNPPGVFAGTRLAKLFFCAAACVLVAELIGTLTIPLGGKLQIILMPLLWALLIGAVWGISSPRLPQALQIDRKMQVLSAAVLQPALLIFVAKLGLLVGGNLPTILQSGWALAFQELGHFFGTMVFGLPLALLLGIKREAIGATFSVGREPSLAIIGEKYGMDSPEGHGVLAEYITGTIFGAAFIAIFAGLIASLGIFNPLALAMGAGVGSGSMMAAASGAIAAQETPEVAKQVAAFAAAANLVTVTIGTYFTLFLSLPFTVWLYGKLEPVLGRTRAISSVAWDKGLQRETSENLPQLSAVHLLAIWLASGLMALFGNWYSYKAWPDREILAGLAIIVAVVAVGFAIYRLTKNALPAVLFVSLIAMVLTYPGVPYADAVSVSTGKINFLALATPVIAYAGLSIAKDVPVFRKLGWRIVLVSLVANAGTFIGATLIAQFFVHPHI